MLLRSLFLFFALTVSSLSAHSEEYFGPEINTEEQECFWWWDTPDSTPEAVKSPNNPFKMEKIKGLEERLNKKILGQQDAIKKTVTALTNYATGLKPENSPIATLLYVGPRGVGKTQLAKELAKEFFGDESALISDLYTRDVAEEIKRNPYSIVFIEEMGYSDLAYMLRPAFESGFFMDLDGELVDCRNVLFILSTNIGSEKIVTLQETGHSKNEITQSVENDLKKSWWVRIFYPKVDPVIFFGIDKDLYDAIVNVMLQDFAEELKNKKNITLDYDPSIPAFIKKFGEDKSSGVRSFKKLFKETVLTSTALAIQENYLSNGDKVTIKFENDFLICKSNRKSESYNWKWTGKNAQIEDKGPIDFMTLLSLEDKLQKRVLGQSQAIKTTVSALFRYAAGLKKKNCPIGAILYVGPTGVGKTQLAKEVAQELFGEGRNLIRFDMSEFIEEFSYTTLIGSPPGYVGYEEGGVLTNALMENPYSVVLLDEIEKAHPKVRKLFLQVFDDGRLTSARGELVDCSHALFILTTNVGGETILKMGATNSSEDKIMQSILPELVSELSPELFNRLDCVLFKGISRDLMNQLVLNMLQEMTNEIKTKKNITLSFDNLVADYFRINGFSYEFGARPLKRLIQQTVVTQIAREIVLGHIVNGDSIHVTLESPGKFQFTKL